MFGLKNFRQLRTSSCIKGFRACKHNTAVPQRVLDKGRVQAGEAGRAWHNIHQIWLATSPAAVARSGRT